MIKNINPKHLDILANRTITSFPLSVGTGLAMEACLPTIGVSIDPERKFEKFSLTQYQQIWFNLLTLHRNMINSLETQYKREVDYKACGVTLSDEINFLRKHISDTFQGQVKPVFYACHYDALPTRFRHAALRNIGDGHEKDDATILMERSVSTAIMDQQDHPDVIVFDKRIKPKLPVKALILTNYAIDLLEYSEFLKLDLLESHTSTRKTHSQWNTKFSGTLTDEEALRIPFNALTLQIYGEPRFFGVMKKSARQALSNLAKLKKWTTTTSDDVVLRQLRDVSLDAYTSSVFIEMMKAK